MGLYVKDEGSKHEDIVHYCEQQPTQLFLCLDLPQSEGTMKICRELVNFLNSSPQAMKKLHSKQV
jgi:hypothetical protein